MLSQTQILIYFLGSITLLIALIVALIFIIIMRDRGELKAKEMATDLTTLEAVVGDMKKIKDDLVPALSAFKKHEAALSQIEGQLKQISAAVASLAHRPQPVGAIREKQDDRRDRDRDRGPKQSGKGKGWAGNRSDSRQKEFVSAVGDAGEAVAINDGEKYAKMSELAAHGMSAQEIAKKLNVGPDEVALVLELKGKKPV